MNIFTDPIYSKDTFTKSKWLGRRGGCGLVQTIRAEV